MCVCGLDTLYRIVQEDVLDIWNKLILPSFGPSVETSAYWGAIWNLAKQISFRQKSIDVWPSYMASFEWMYG